MPVFSPTATPLTAHPAAVLLHTAAADCTATRDRLALQHARVSLIICLSRASLDCAHRPFSLVCSALSCLLLQPLSYLLMSVSDPSTPLPLPKWHQHGVVPAESDALWHVVSVGHDCGPMALYVVIDSDNNRAFLQQLFELYAEDSLGDVITSLFRVNAPVAPVAGSRVLGLAHSWLRFEQERQQSDDDELRELQPKDDDAGAEFSKAMADTLARLDASRALDPEAEAVADAFSSVHVHVLAGALQVSALPPSGMDEEGPLGDVDCTAYRLHRASDRAEEAQVMRSDDSDEDGRWRAATEEGEDGEDEEVGEADEAD